jgi:transposase
MPDVSSTAPEQVRLWVALDVHKFSIVAATLPPHGGAPEVQQIESAAAAVRRFVARLGGPAGLAVCYEAGPGGYDLLRLLSGLGVACDVVAPSLVPVRAGARVKTDRRDAEKLVRLFRAGELRFVVAPSPEHEGLRDLVRCRDDVRRARTAARHQVAKQLLRHGRVYREGKKAWTQRRIAWVRAQRLEHPLAQRALEHARAHLDSLDAQLRALDAELAQIARGEPWVDPVRWLCAFRGVGYRTALGLLAEIGDWRRFGHPRELAAYLGLVPCEYSSGEQRHRGHITRAGNHHARRLLVEAAWRYRHRPRRARTEPDVPPEVSARAWRAQVRLHHRHRALTAHGKRSTVATVAVARELAGFLWAAMTDQPIRDDEQATAA